MVLRPERNTNKTSTLTYFSKSVLQIPLLNVSKACPFRLDFTLTVWFLTVLYLIIISTHLISFYCLCQFHCTHKNVSSKPNPLHTFHWFARLLNADRGLIDSSWMLRSSLSHEKQPYPWPNSLLSARATVTQLSAVNLMNQRQKGDIALTHSLSVTLTQTHKHRAVSKHKEEGQDKLVRSSRSPAKPAGSQIKSSDWFPTDTELTVSLFTLITAHRGFNPWRLSER